MKRVFSIAAIILLFLVIHHYVANSRPKEGGLYYIDALTALFVPSLSF